MEQSGFIGPSGANLGQHIGQQHPLAARAAVKAELVKDALEVVFDGRLRQVQRFGDLVSGIRTNEHRMSKSFVHPTLTAAVPGDLSLALPKRQLDDIIEMIYQLDKLAPGTANYDTLLYGAEVKFYSARLALSNELETALPGFFAVGDGAGVTRGLAQAGASGVKVAQVISERLK